MKPLFLKLAHLSLIIIPDTQAHLNGHLIITRTYSLYSNSGKNDPVLMQYRENKLLLEKDNDPDYYGRITFELPDKLFTYAAGSIGILNADQVEQVIEFLSDIRSNPDIWNSPDL